MHSVIRGLVGMGTFATFVGVGVSSAQALPRPDQALVRTGQPTVAVPSSAVAVSAAPVVLVPLTTLPPLTLRQSTHSVPLTSTPLQRAATVPTTVSTPAIATPVERRGSSTAPALSVAPATPSTETTPLPPTVAPAATLAAPTPEPAVMPTAASLPPDVKLIRNSSQGYWLEVTPPIAKAVEPRTRDTASPVQSAPQTVVSPTETTGYQGIPAPPVSATNVSAINGYPSNYQYQTVSPASNYQPSPQFPQALNLPTTLDSFGSSLHYPLPQVCL